MNSIDKKNMMISSWGTIILGIIILNVGLGSMIYGFYNVINYNTFHVVIFFTVFSLLFIVGGSVFIILGIKNLKKARSIKETYNRQENGLYTKI